MSSPSPAKTVAAASSNGAASEPSAAVASSSSNSAAEKKAPRAARTPEEQAKSDAENKLKPCFDLAEKKSCERGDACRFSHDAAVLANAEKARQERDAAVAAKKARHEQTKKERAEAREAKKAEDEKSGVVKEKKVREKKVKQPVASAADGSISLPAGPESLPTNPSAPDLQHTLVRNAISARHPRASHKTLSALQNKPFLIGVTGGTASGKTTVCDEMCEKLGGRVALLQMDRFYKSLPHGKPASEHNFDIPEAFDWDLFVKTLKQLSTGTTVQVPQYSFVTHQRLEKLDTFEPQHIIMIEGLLVLHDARIREQLDLKVFIEADSDVRLARRIHRDIAERGRKVDGVIDQYLSTVKPAHERYIQPSARFADIIVPHNGPKNGVAIDLLAQHVSTEIYKRGAKLNAPHGKKSGAAAGVKKEKKERKPKAEKPANGNGADEKKEAAPVAASATTQ